MELRRTSEGQPMEALDDPKVMETEHGDSRRRKLENLRATMIQLARSNPSIPCNMKLIQENLSRLPLSHIPDHPTYAAMIWRAISELNEDGGSSEEAISRFIEAEYKDLPCAHAGLLHHHLQNLVDKEEIIRASTSCYRLPSANTNSHCKVKKGHKQVRRHSRSRKIGRRKIEAEKNLLIGVENKSESKEQNVEALPQSEDLEDGNPLQKSAMELIEPHKKEVNCGQSLVEEREAGVVTEQNQACRRQVEEFAGLTQGESIENEQEAERTEEENPTHVKGFKSSDEQRKAEEQMKQIKEQDQLKRSGEQNKHGIMEMNEDNSTHEKGFRSTEELRKMEEQQSKAIKEQGQVKLMGEHVEESSERNETEWGNKMSRKRYQTQEKQNHLQNGLDKQQVGVPKMHSKEQDQAEENHEVTTVVFLEEEEGNLIQELRYEEKNLREEIEIEDKSQPEDLQIKDFEEQVQSWEMQNQVIEQNEMEAQIEISKQQKRLQEQQQKLYSDILDLRKMLEQFTNKQEGDGAVMAGPSLSLTSQSLDFSGSLLISKEGCVEMLKKANKIGGRLIKIIGTFSEVEVRGKQTELFQGELMQTTRPCREWNPVMGSTSEIQEEKQGEINGQQKAVSYQLKPMVSFLDAHTDQSLHQQKQNIKIPNLKRPPEVEIAILEQSLGRQKQSDLCCDPRDTSICQSKSLCFPSDVPDKSLLDKGMKMERQQRIQAIKTLEQNIGVGREMALSGPAMRKTYQNVSRRNLEQLETENRLENLEGHPKGKPAKDHSWGLKLSELESVSTIATADPDLVHASLKPDLNHQPEPLTSEMLLFVGNRNVDDSSCPVEQLRCNYQGEQLTCQPETTSLDSSPVSEQLLMGIQVQESSECLDLAAVEEFTQNQHVKGQLQPEDQDPSRPELASHKTMAESFQSLHQNEQQGQLGSQDQANVLKLRGDMDCFMGEPSPSDHCSQHEQQQLQRRGRGRPPKPKKKTDVTMEVTMLSDHLKNEQQGQLGSQDQANVLKLRGDMDCVMGEPSPSDQLSQHKQQQLQHRGRGRPPKPKKKTDVTMEVNMLSDHLKNEQQHKKRHRGRPSKLKPVVGTNVGVLSISQRHFYLEEKQLQDESEDNPLTPEQGTTSNASLFLSRKMLQQLPEEKISNLGRITKPKAAASLEESLVLQNIPLTQPPDLVQGRITRARSAATGTPGRYWLNAQKQ